jgi:DNA-3-methyladenine glycosylase II
MLEIVNPEDVKQLIKTDELFSKIEAQYGLPPNWSRPQGFITLSKIILEQQVSLASAKAHFDKLNNHLIEFSPREILKLSDDDLKICCISRQKSHYLRELSKAILEEKLDLEKFSELPSTEVKQQLTAIKGIGNWTADVYLMFCLQAKDIFPIGDIAIVNTMKELTNTVSKDEMLEYSKKWSPYESLATFFLWHYYLKKRGRSLLSN